MNLTISAARPLSKDDHACFMLAAAVSLGHVAGAWPRQFLLETAPERISDVIKDIRPDGYVDVLLMNNLLSPERFEGIASKMLSDHMESKWPEDSYEMRVAPLASPLLDGSVVKGMLESVADSDVARAALMANPNCPAELCRPDELSTRQRTRYQEALSMFGDLRRESVQTQLAVLIAQSGGMTPNASESRKTCVNHLVQRSDLPEALAAKIDPIAIPSIYEALAKTPAHQTLVASNQLTGTNKLVNNGMPSGLVISPAVTPPTLVSLFNTHKRDNPEYSRVVASHKKAPIEIVTEAIAAQNPSIAYKFGTQLVENKSPHAEYAIGLIQEKFPTATMPGNLGDLDGASEELLALASTKDIAARRPASLASVMCNPNFPWKEIGVPKDMLKDMRAENALALQAARAIKEGGTPDEFEHALGNEMAATALLFSSSISSRRIAKLVERHPGITALAAVHPNGFDVPTEGLEPETRSIVSGLRSSPLEGPSATVASGKTTSVLQI